MTAAASVSMIGVPELLAALSRLDEVTAEEAIREALMAGALPVQNAAKENAPKKKRDLARSIHSEVTEVDAKHGVVEVGTDVVYAAIQEFGGTITPKTAKMLHWVDDDGNDVFASSVTIPAHPYLRPALAEHIDDANEAMNRVLKIKIEQVAP